MAANPKNRRDSLELIQACPFAHVAKGDDQIGPLQPRKEGRWELRSALMDVAIR